VNGEEHARGIQVKPNASTIAQITFHTDHPFWDSFVHDSPLHFDQIAAQFVGASGVPMISLEQTPTAAAAANALVGLDFKAFKDKAGNGLPYRYCSNANGPAYTMPMAAQMSFDNLSVPYHLGGADPTQLRDYRDFVNYGQSTQGHLNADGLCFVKRNYPSPP
jgi:hypothetical protein